MPGPLSIADEAPNFDLSSTENAVLMLRDEVARNAAVLYFFADPAGAQVQRDLDALNRSFDRLARRKARVLAVSPAGLDGLKKVQAERKLLFPLLHDDRRFSASYGVDPSAPALVVVGRSLRVLWLANPITAVAEALPQIEKVLEDQPSPAKGYPQSVINRLIDRWVS